MKQIVFVFLLSILFQSVNAQEIIDSCGMNNDALMNSYEANFLNDYYRDKGQFDFSDKKIAFITGGGGAIISSKSEYFNHVKQWKNNHNTTIETKLIVLNLNEKELSGGYDAIVLFWVKFFPKGQKQKILQRLGSGEGL
ncbi:MAG: hypothetical protein PHR53_08095 [Bacteroidales bacterium]|nr:hypothetical protein [Bacteroidales bacterium]